MNSTDTLLSHVTEEKFETLKIANDEITVNNAYPETEEKLTSMVVFDIDSENKITKAFYASPQKYSRSA